MIKNEELMPFKKFVESILKVLYHEDTITIYGTFKESDGSIHTGDIFEAHLIGNRTLEETYKAYLHWFNYTRYPNELSREFVSVKRHAEMP
jgi:hypothetical protein